MTELQRSTPNPTPSPHHAAPPWHLVGAGFLLVYRFSRRAAIDAGWVPAALQDSYRGGLGALLLIDYQTSDVGPYRELLFIPGRFALGGQSYFRITEIVVSTEASVVWGRRNWGIPKERADFEFGDRHVRVWQDGRTLCDAHFETSWGRLPVHAGLVPPAWRTLWQTLARRQFWTVPSARGWARHATPTALTTTSELPALSQQRPLLTLRLEQVHLYFPVPDIREENHCAVRG